MAAAAAAAAAIKASFAAWVPPPKWRQWVEEMRSSHHATWRKAGILNAIISTTYIVNQDQDLIMELVEKWSPITNTFVFEWGEATVTLEDMVVLGGYSVLGESVSTQARGAELEAKVDELFEARRELNRSTAKKACLNKWMIKFMGSGSEIEHEAFLAYWLSKFVFPFYSKAIGTSVLPIAVRLARGTRVALAPALLSSIYRGLRLLKEALEESDDERVVLVKAPMPLVQVWAWERFPGLGPEPDMNWVRRDEPRIARWCRTTSGSSITDCTGEGFRWQPYVGGDVFVDDEELERCVRASELVGVEKGCVERYLPHRVAMQFGTDRNVEKGGEVDPEIAWCDNVRPVGDEEPPRSSRPCVARRYFKRLRRLDGASDEDSQVGAERVEEDIDDDDSQVGAERVEEDIDDDDSQVGAERVEEDIHAEAADSEQVIKKGCESAKSSYKRTKRRYIEQFRRRRNVESSFVPAQNNSGDNESSDDDDYSYSAPKSSERNENDVQESYYRAEEKIGLSNIEERVRNLENIFRLLEAGKISPIFPKLPLKTHQGT